ncbi:tyrosine-type recombinase/integrase [Ectobacillus funiculus]|uniref:tyrosine-type recombinase/integrase n=1 Tax=Ectobacillus funiculus TaxID=137993 RepID=UPI00101D9613|nr:tyrosine-type recombinase/integrase [Ectobacillus funiculus]
MDKLDITNINDLINQNLIHNHLIQNNIHDAINILIDNKYIHTMNIKIELAEKEGRKKYEYLSDMEVIYYYVHFERDMDEKKNRKRDTKQIYLKELLTFCQTLIKDADVFDIRGEEVEKKGSLLQVLAPWNIRRYNDWLKTAKLGRGGKPYSVATLAKKVTIIRSFLKHLYTMSYIEAPLHEELQKANVRSEDRPNRDLSYGEVMQILEYYRQERDIFSYTILLALASTGARIQELCQARVKDLFYAEGKYWLRVTGKRDKQRDLFISDYLFQCICEFRKRRGYETDIKTGDIMPLLLNRNGKIYNFRILSNQVTEMVAKTGLEFLKYRENPVTAHTFRHAFAIMSVEEGNADLYHLMHTLGHESIKTSQIYLEKYMKRKNNVGVGFADKLK